MNQFEVRGERVEVDIPAAGVWELAVPVIDGTPLADRFEDRAPGIEAELVTFPSRHWLGAPVEAEDGRADVLTGACGEPQCCGVYAQITLDRVVTWSDFIAHGRQDVPGALHFVFDRADYERALATFRLT